MRRSSVARRWRGSGFVEYRDEYEPFALEPALEPFAAASAAIDDGSVFGEVDDFDLFKAALSRGVRFDALRAFG